MKNTCANVSEHNNIIWNELLPTWQPLAAISHRAGLPIRTCEKILVQMYNDGKVKCSRVRIDGHNKVHMFKKIEYMTVLSMKMVVDTSNLEFAENDS